MSLPKSLLIRGSLSIGLSAVALVVSAILQGALFFPEHLETARNPVQTTIHRFSIASDGNSALVVLKHNSRAMLDRPSRTVALWSCNDNGCPVRHLPLDFVAFNAVRARTGNHSFACAENGRLFAFRLDSQTPSPRLLGSHGEGFAHDIECTYDGSIVILANRRFISGWSPNQPGYLWRRDDLDVSAACFLGQTTRLFCGVANGEVHELDGHTGESARTFSTSCGLPISIDLSPDGKLLAILHSIGGFLVIDLTTHQPLWGRKFPSPAAGPRFSPDGQFLISPSENRAPTLHVLTATTGEQVAELMGAKAPIAGIACSNGIVYAWDASGTITAWNLASGSLLRRFSVACLPPPAGSS